MALYDWKSNDLEILEEASQLVSKKLTVRIDLYIAFDLVPPTLQINCSTVSPLILPELLRKLPLE